MFLRPSLVLARNELWQLRRDPWPFVVTLVMPLALIGLIAPASELILKALGGGSANGAEHAVPGMAVMFSYFQMSFAGYAFFREHHWGTWDRIRASSVHPFAIVIGKLLPYFALVAGQVVLLLALGRLLFDLQIEGAVVRVLGVTVLFSSSVVALGAALVALCRTVQQFDSIATLLALVLPGIGGALTPAAALPTWVQQIALASPAYWAMAGFNAALSGRGSIAVPCVALAAFGILLSAVAALSFRTAERKLAWA